MSNLREAAQKALEALEVVPYMSNKDDHDHLARVIATLRAALAEPPRWTDADADASRLALELECLMTDKDVPMPALSRWWASGHDALDLHRQRLRGEFAEPDDPERQT